MVHACCVPGCRTIWKSGCGLRFHRFPSKLELRLKWVEAIRSGKRASDYMKVCSKHFKEDDYFESSTSGYYILKIDAIPTQNLSNEQRLKTGKTTNVMAALKERKVGVISDNYSDVPSSKYTLQLPGESGKSTIFQECIPVSITMSQKQLLYLTGFTQERFDALFEFCMRNDPTVPQCNLSTEDQFVLLLCKCTLNLDYMSLGKLFKISPMSASNLFVLWTNIMYAKFQLVDWWNLKFTGDNLYTVIIGFVEIPTVGSPYNLESQEYMFSTFRNKSILKGLVGIDEAGTVIFCSDLYGGSIGDSEMAQLSGLLCKVVAGNVVLADRELDISDLLETKGATLRFPPFIRTRALPHDSIVFSKTINEQETMNLMKRITELSNMHKIVNDLLPEYLWGNAHKIFYNCMIMCNFKNGCRHEGGTSF